MPVQRETIEAISSDVTSSRKMRLSEVAAMSASNFAISCSNAGILLYCNSAALL